MPEGTPAPSTERYRGLIARKAARMCRQPGFSPSDVDDIAQELHIKVLQSVEQHDPSKGAEAPLVVASVERRAANLVRDRNATCRQPARQMSLSLTVKSGEHEISVLAAEIGPKDLEARTGVRVRSETDTTSLRQDVEECVQKLDAEHQPIVRALMQFPLAEAARRLNIPRTTLQRRLATIREVFEQSEMRDYLT